MAVYPLNKILCVDTVKNTGKCDCYFDPKLIKGKILVPKSRVLTQAEINAIQATLEALVQAEKTDRFFPVQNFEALTDNSEDPTFQTFGFGGSAPVREGNYNWIFQFIEGGVQLNNALRSFNGKSSKYAEVYIDYDNNSLIGTKKLDANGEWGLAGVPQNGGYPYTYPWKANDGTNVTQYRTQSNFRPEYVNENLAFVAIPKDVYLLSELAGLETVNIAVEEIADDTLTISGATDCGADFFDEYLDELDGETTAFVLKDPDGAEMTINSVAITAAAGDNPATVEIMASETILDGSTIELAAPTVLAAAPINVEGYDSEAATIEVGSS